MKIGWKMVLVGFSPVNFSAVGFPKFNSFNLFIVLITDPSFCTNIMASPVFYNDQCATVDQTDDLIIEYCNRKEIDCKLFSMAA